MEEINNNTKYIWDFNSFKNKEFKIIPLPTSLGIQLNKSPFGDSENIKKIQREWLENCGHYNEKEVEETLKKEHLAITSVLFSMVNEKGFEFLVLLFEQGYLLDDEYFEKGTFESMLEVYVDRKNKNQELIGKLIWDIYDRYDKYGNMGNINRMIIENESWARGSVVANKKNVFNSELTFEEYSIIRNGEISGRCVAAMMMACCDEYVSDEIYYTDEFQLLIHHYSVLGFLSNDLYSFKKELYYPTFSNGIKILAIQNGGNIQDAIDQVYQFLIDRFKLFHKSIEIISTKYQNEKNVQEYLRRIKMLADGTYYLHLSSSRYTNY